MEEEPRPRVYGLTDLVAPHYPHQLPDGRTVMRDYSPGIVVLKMEKGADGQEKATIEFRPYDP